MLEGYHDAVQAMDDSLNMFNLGAITIEQRALIERLFWAVCGKILRMMQRARFHAGGVARLEGDAVGHLLLQLLGVPVDAR